MKTSKSQVRAAKKYVYKLPVSNPIVQAQLPYRRHWEERCDKKYHRELEELGEVIGWKADDIIKELT